MGWKISTSPCCRRGESLWVPLELQWLDNSLDTMWCIMFKPLKLDSNSRTPFSRKAAAFLSSDTYINQAFYPTFILPCCDTWLSFPRWVPTSSRPHLYVVQTGGGKKQLSPAKVCLSKHFFRSLPVQRSPNLSTSVICVQLDRMAAGISKCRM